MMKLDKKQIIELLERVPMRKNCSAWNRGVKNYADILIDNLEDDYCMIFDNQRELEEQFKILKKLLLSGADSWNQYSYYGNAYIYDEEIAAATILEGSKRYLKLFKTDPPKYVYLFVKRQKCFKNGISEPVGGACGRLRLVCLAQLAKLKGQ